MTQWLTENFRYNTREFLLSLLGIIPTCLPEGCTIYPQDISIG